MPSIISAARAGRVHRYQPLQSDRHIRLLEFHERNGSLALSIAEYHIDRAPEYETVSYVWGMFLATERVGLDNGDDLLMTSSLARALPYLCTASQTRRLWIDQITVDQLNITERCNQVSMMGQIYARCIRCLIWIDTDRSITSNLDLDLQWSNGTGAQIRSCLQSFREDEFLELLRATSNNQPRRISTTSIEIPRHEQIVRDHLLWFLEHPWFSRTWVFQEFVLSRETIFLIGDFQLPGAELDNVFRLGWPKSRAWYAKFHDSFNITRKRAASFDSAPGMQFLLTASALKRMHTEHEIRRKNRRAQSLHPWDTFVDYEACYFAKMLDELSDSHALDLRDHVYALLGLAPFLLRHMRVDYTIPVEQAFAVAVKAVIKESRSLDFLGCLPSESNRSRSTLDLPSWVPNWTIGCDVSAILDHDNQFCASGSGFGLPGVPHCKHYDPSDAVWSGLRWNELAVPGKVIDTVRFSLDKLSIYQTQPAINIDVRECTGRLPWQSSTLNDFVNNLRDLGCDESDSLSWEALLRTLFMDGVGWAALDALGLGESLYRTGIRTIGQPHHEKVKDVIDAVLSSFAPTIDALPHHLSVELLHELSKKQYGRRVYLGSSLQFGLGPDTVQQGDLVALLHGSRAPVLIRKVEKAFHSARTSVYRIIGQCYHDGAMYGDLADANDGDAAIFTLV